jgi:transposase InsO family protein
LRIKKKRNETAVKKVELVREMKSEHSVPYATGVAMADVSYPTFMRWNGRYESGGELVSAPGPKKIERLELDALMGDVFRLGFGPKRTCGTGDIHWKYRNQISRRDLDSIISEARREALDERLASMRRITWNTPRSVWSMDVTEAAVNGGKVFVNLLQDMSSKYKLHSIADYEEPYGEEIAGQLEYAFRKNGPPLFLKRDNGGNLNHAAVRDVLERHMVIPFNSPPSYPQFNGSLEKANGEMKSEESFRLVKELEAYKGNELLLFTDNVLNCLNHKERGILHGKCSCLVFFSSEKLNVTRRDRKEIYEWIIEQKLEIKEELGDGIKDDKATRLAIETWLLMNGHITVARNGEVLPYLREQNLS